MTIPIKDAGLTLEQMRFADAHHATSTRRCAQESDICLYREQPRETVRWIIDGSAHVLERTAFRGC